jgi:signal peptidase I
MKRGSRQKKQLIEALAIITVVMATLGGYLALKLYLGTDLPLTVVASGSMSPTLETGDLIVVQGVNSSEIKVRDIILFDLVEDNETERTVHRVVYVQILSNGTRVFTTKGDNNTIADSVPIPESQIHGRVFYRIPLVGYLALDPMIPLAIIIVILIISLVWPEKSRRKKHKLRSRIKHQLTNPSPSPHLT